MLRRCRLAAKLTQAALAEAAGLSEQAIGLLERGVRKRPYRGTVLALAAAMDLGPETTAALLSAAGGQEAGVSPSVAAPDRAPRQLPPDVADFAGRSTELRWIADALRAGGDQPGTTVLALHGLAGVGKTTLATHAAHLAAESFPDGQLYIDLQGYGPGGALTASAALRVLLVSLGLREQAVPVDLDAASQLYRSLLTGTRTLVVLDNASDREVLKRLLPDGPRCAAIVTGRRALSTGSTSLQVAPLDDDDALSMLGRIIGSERVSAETEAARTIIRTSHGLPLIVRLVGARLDRRQDWALAEVAHQARPSNRRIDHLGVTAAVHATVSSSLEYLENLPGGTGAQAASAFDFLGLIDAAELTQTAVGALLDLPAETTQAVMAQLLDLHLVGSPRPGVYRLHDLLRSVAGERALRNLAPEERQSALWRVIDLYLAAAWECQSGTHPSSERVKKARPGMEPISNDLLPARLEWFDFERASVIALANQLAVLAGDFTAPLIELGWAMFGYFEFRARWPELREVALLCRRAAPARADQSYFMYLAGIADWEQEHFETALDHFTEGLALAEQSGDLKAVARCALAVARTLEGLDRFEEAIVSAERAISASQESDYLYALGAGQMALGALYARCGRMDEAESCLSSSVELARGAGDLQAAARRHGVAGDAYAAAGTHSRAIPHFRAALEIYATAPGPACLAFVHRRLGTSLLASGSTDEAAGAFDVGLDLARESADLKEQAKILAQLAELQVVRGNPAAAINHLTSAATLFDDLGMPDSVDLRHRMTELTGATATK
nr:tetratricopeptide repeat protein [Streptomyces sp. SID13031]